MTDSPDQPGQRPGETGNGATDEPAPGGTGSDRPRLFLIHGNRLMPLQLTAQQRTHGHGRDRKLTRLTVIEGGRPRTPIRGSGAKPART